MFSIKIYEFFAIVLIAYHIYYLIDVISSTFKDSINKIMWVLLIVFLPVIGCILYIFIGRKQKQKDL